MAKKIVHTILIVDDEEQVGKFTSITLKKISAKYVYVASGKEALNWIKTASSPFSMILSNQTLQDMTGAQFLEKAKELTPDTLRYLIAGEADIDAIAMAVNQGAVQRYLSKPWNEKEFMETIKKGLDHYELIVENNRLFKLSKEQNEKLYAMSIDLKKNSASHKKDIAEQEDKIEQLNKILEKGFKSRSHINEIQQLLKEKNMMHEKKIESLCLGVTAELFEQFQDIATRHGFTMP